MMSAHRDFHVVVLDEPRRLYRGILDPSQLEDAFKSNYELGRSPHPADLRATVLHMALSFFEDPDVLRRLARRYPRRIGTYVATVDLEPGQGVCVADTAGPGHWSVWGRPAQLAAFTADVERA
jgi:hypothetical protein